MRKNNQQKLFIKKIKIFLNKIFKIEKLIIFELDIEKPIKIIPSPIKLTFRIGTKKDIESMNFTDYDYDEEAKKYSKGQIEKGDRYILAINNDKIVGYVWIMNKYMELSIHNHLPISTKRSYIYRNYVLKDFRGKRVLNAIDNYIINILKEEGKKFIITTISISNKSSIKARDRIGFKRVGKILQIRFFGLKYDYIPKEDLIYLQNL